MAKSILELFETQPIGLSNKPASDVYSIKKNKIEPVTSVNPLINATSMKLFNKLRVVANKYDSETVVEAEATGIRQLRFLSAPILYGIEYPRILTETTATLDTMRHNKTPGQKLFNKINKFVSNTASKIGIKFSTTPIPTVVSEGLEGGNTKATRSTLNKILKDSRGNLAGDVIKKIASSNANDVVSNAVGELVKVGKSTLRKKLFGVNDWKNSNIDSKLSLYGNNYTYQDTMLKLTVKGVSEQLKAANDRSFFLSNPLAQASSKLSESGVPIDKQATPPSNDDPEYKYIKNFIEVENGFNYKLNIGKRGKLPLKQVLAISTALPGENSNVNKYNDTDKKYTSGIKFESGNRDKPYLVYGNIPGSTAKTWIQDFITVSIKNLRESKPKTFLSTISSISDSNNADWSFGKFLGNAIGYRTYSSYDRDIGFSITFFAENQAQQSIMWDNITWLRNLTAPHSYTTDGFIKPNVLQVTVGDLWKDLSCILTSFSLEIDDSTPWTTGLSNMEFGNISSQKWELPFVCTVSLTFSVLIPRDTRKFADTALTNDLGTNN